jgi:hypothetical protein
MSGLTAILASHQAVHMPSPEIGEMKATHCFYDWNESHSYMGPPPNRNQLRAIAIPAQTDRFTLVASELHPLQFVGSYAMKTPRQSALCHLLNRVGKKNF